MFHVYNPGPMNIRSFLPSLGALALVASLSSCAMTNKGQARLYQKAEQAAPYDAVWCRACRSRAANGRTS